VCRAVRGQPFGKLAATLFIVASTAASTLLHKD
jgi:hypothetical protein